MDVPVTSRVRRIIDTAAMRRLASVSQLGLVSLVYPGATHSRFEHSIGVYANAILLLHQIACWQQTAFQIDDPIGHEAFMVAALVHDAGHWPFCHPIEDMGEALVGNGTLTKHEDRVETLLKSGAIAECLCDDWSCNADDVMSILRPKTYAKRTECQLSPDSVSFFASCLSGPIDVDKLDYLQRDSLHAGVPYGRNFDAERIFHSLRIHPQTPKLAIDEKGRTAAEMMVFGRYVMFSEVYWHHTVRAATAMLQRALFELQKGSPEVSASPKVDPRREDNWEVAQTPISHSLGSHSSGSHSSVFRWSDEDDPRWIVHLREAAKGSGNEAIMTLVEGLFGPTRRLQKRVAQFNVETGDDVHSRLARRPYRWLVERSERLAEQMSTALGIQIPAELVLIDAPPTKLEVDINMDVIGRGGRCLTLGQVSPVASVLANQQFDNHVKRVRVFVPESIRNALHDSFSDPVGQLQNWLIESVE
jgi:HD superfamily phosphohydrolase